MNTSGSFFLLTLIYKRILGFFPSFVIGVMAQMPHWSFSLWVGQIRAVKGSLAGPWYLLLLDMPGCRHPEDESFRWFLSQAGREKKELICCAEIPKFEREVSHSEHPTPHLLSYRFRIFAVLKIIST